MAAQVYFEDVSAGTEIPKLERVIELPDLVRFAAGSGDFNPLHYDPKFAQGMGVQSNIVHGRFKYALLGEMLWNWIAPAGRIKKFSCQYRGMDLPGEAVTCRGAVQRTWQEDGQNLVELEIWTENGQGQRTSPGSAVVSLPSRA